MCLPAPPPGHRSSAMREPAPQTGDRRPGTLVGSAPRTGPSPALSNTSAPDTPARSRDQRPAPLSGHSPTKRLGLDLQSAFNPLHERLLGAHFLSRHPAEAVAIARDYGKRRGDLTIESRRHGNRDPASTHRNRTRFPGTTAAIDGAVMHPRSAACRPQNAPRDSATRCSKTPQPPHRRASALAPARTSPKGGRNPATSKQA